MPAFKSVTQISRAFGMTVPALKRVLADAGYLNGRHPTDKALADGMFERRSIVPGAPESGDFAVWDEAKVAPLLDAAGKGGNAGYGVWSCHSAADRLAEAADLANQSQRRRSPEVQTAIAWCQYEAIEILGVHMDAGRRAAGDLVRREAASLIEYLCKAKADDEAGRTARRKVEAG